MGSKASTPQNRPVVVGMDGSRSTPGTVDLAVAEAARRGAPLQIVHVWPGRYRGVFRSRNLAPSRADGLRLLDVTARRAGLAGPGLSISTELLEGGAATVLTGCSARARLLVVGHRDDPLTRPTWGTTAAYLAHHSECPLVVNRGAGHSGPVVVASSARRSGAATLGHAFAEAELLGTRLVAVHMWARPGAADGSAPVVAKGGYAIERRAAEARLAEALGDWSERFPAVAVERLVAEDRRVPVRAVGPIGPAARDAARGPPRDQVLAENRPKVPALDGPVKRFSEGMPEPAPQTRGRTVEMR